VALTAIDGVIDVTGDSELTIFVAAPGKLDESAVRKSLEAKQVTLDDFAKAGV
jgi:hypothetical protein